MLSLLRHPPLSGSFFPMLFRSSWIVVCLAAILFSPGIVTGATAQTQPVDSSQSAPATTGQAQPSTSAEEQTAPVAEVAPAQGLVHIVPFGRGSAGIKNTAAPAGAHLTYFGGPVISNLQVVVVFWGPNVNPVVTANGAIDQFYTDITSSRFFDLLTEYSTTGIAGAGASSNQSIGHGTFGGKFTISPALCPGPAACTVTDAQIRTELTNQINAQVLPAPTTDLHGIINTYYAIYFPPGVSINDGTSLSCVKGGFCAYHSSTASLVPYGVLPDFAASGCSTGCGAGTLFDNITAVSSHEMSEATTDAQVGSVSGFGPPLAWYDHDSPPGTDLAEIGDICTAHDASVSAGGHAYSIQQEFSNLQNDCVSAPPVFHMTAGAATLSTPFNLTLRVQSSATPTISTGYTGTVHFTSSDAQAILPADYTFVTADGGSHIFPVTMNSTGSQTINIVDTHSSGFTGALTLSAPIVDLQAAVAGGALSQGQIGASYTASFTNIGSVASSDLVTVFGSLGPGLTLTAFSGTGWSCILAPPTCTRSDPLGAGLSYPDITLVFNVAVNAPATAAVGASVSNPGDANSANNTDSINVPITPIFNVPPTITSSSPDVTVTAGQPATFVFGIGAGTGVGTVTFSCSGLPATASCRFSPTSLAASGDVTMIIGTTARSSTIGMFNEPSNRNPLLFILLLFLAAFATFNLGLSAPKRRRLVPALGITGVLSLVMLVGCGGGSSAPPPVIGTQAGTFPVTFTATGPAGAASKTVNLIVR
ncbi:MAG TPA: hypothetical protein VGK24_14695 [Candidatus Angelobacter sp.]